MHDGTFGSCFHGCVSHQDSRRLVCALIPNVVHLRLFTRGQCSALAPWKSSTGTSSRKSGFVVKAQQSRCAAGLGEGLSETPRSVSVELVTLCGKADLELRNIVLILLFAYS